MKSTARREDAIGAARSDAGGAPARARQSVTIRPPFFVLATQNPIELEGTYPLPEAQLDRFIFNVLLDYSRPTTKLRCWISPPHASSRRPNR